jgi:hypothetical protein
MLVKLQRDLFLGEHFFKARSGGIEIPDTIEGKAVVLHADKGKSANCFVLPKDAVRLDAAKPPKPTKDEAVALSEFASKQAAAKSFVAAMKKVDDED